MATIIIRNPRTPFPYEVFEANAERTEHGKKLGEVVVALDGRSVNVYLKETHGLSMLTRAANVEEGICKLAEWCGVAPTL